MKKIVCFILSLVFIVNSFCYEVVYNGTKYTEEQWDAYIEQFDIETQYKMDADATYVYTEKEKQLNDLYKEYSQLNAEIKYLRATKQNLGDRPEKLRKVIAKIGELENDNWERCFRSNA